MEFFRKGNKQAQAVIDHQAKIDRVKEQIGKITEATHTQESIISAAASFQDECPVLLARRQDLAADVALGIDRSVNLAELDKALDQARKAAADHSKKYDVETAKQALAGLQSKLAQAQVELASLEGNRAAVIGSFLKAQAEEIADEYIAQAEKMIDAFIKLRALDNMIRTNGTPGAITGAYHDGDLNIPVFALDSFAGKTHPNWPGFLTKAVNVRGATWDHVLMNKTIESLQAEYAAQGVTL